VHQARPEALEQLALPEHDHGLVAGALREVPGAVGGLAGAYEVDQELRTAGEEKARDRERRGEGDGSDRDVYWRAFLSSSVIAGTISVRSPITA
jgi:hypothetical protein